MPTILLIDDDQMVQNVTTEILSFLGYTVFSAGNGHDALEIIKRQADSIDLVLLDLSLPDIDGADMIPLIRQKRQDMKIILCTGAMAKLDSETFCQSGVLTILQKPFDMTDLKEILGNYVPLSPS